MIPTPAHRIRMVEITLLLIAALMVLSFRLYDLQVLRHSRLTKDAAKQHKAKKELLALRGSILDCNENILVQSSIVHKITADPTAIQNEETRLQKEEARLKLTKPNYKRPAYLSELISILADQLVLPEAEIRKKLAQKSQFVILKKKISDDVKMRLFSILKEEHLLRGHEVNFEEEQMRFYINGPMMSHVLGFVNAEQVGMDGVERLMQKDLQGENGWRKFERDRRGKEIYRVEDFQAHNGYNVVLTLDQTIQNIVEEELDAGMKTSRPDCATVIVMRPSTGEILALSNRPTFDPNSSDKRIDTLKNLATAYLIEPGSTFKVVTVAAALDQRLISPTDTIWCENGKFLYGGRYLTDHEAFGNLTVTGVLEKSSNIGAAKISLMLGNQRMHQAMRNFGFGEKTFGDQTGGQWPGEIRGIVRPIKDWSQISITRVAMGHEVSVTPIQMTNAMCALANGGNLMQPHIVKCVTDQDHHIIREFFPKVRKHVIDRKAARQMTEALKQVVSKDGTAMKASVPGFAVAGKTGTAQKIINGEYAHDKFVASFCGYLPADDPEICIYVMMDNPKGKDYFGGAVAAPLFSKMAERIASYMNLKPSSTPASQDASVSVALGGPAASTSIVKEKVTR